MVFYYTAMRGTEPSSLADWKASSKQAFLIKSSQYEQAVDLAKDVFEATGGNVVFVGHSLGGGLASAAAYATGANAITFNASGLSWRYRRKGKPGSIRAHYMRGEILSYMQDSSILLPNAAGRRILHRPKKWYHGRFKRHGIEQFL